MIHKMNDNPAWLLAKAEEEGNDIISVGGLLHTLAVEEGPAETLQMERTALAKLVELRRRQLRLTPEQLADMANVDLDDIVRIEQGDLTSPEPRTIHLVSQVLKLPERALMQLAGLVKPTDARFRTEAVRFAARSEPVANLLPEEHEALEEFVKYLARI
jgi:HTH-type transcriptional regulator, competence development regulator